MASLSAYWISPWVCLILVCPVLIWGQVEFELEGSTESYAKFPGWVPCDNGSLYVEFRTTKASQLLLYMDTGHGEYFQVKMVRKVGMLRWSLGQRVASVLTAGHDLDDDQWHRLEITRDGYTTYLKIDNLERSRLERGDDVAFGVSGETYYLYMGGLPVGYDARTLDNRFVVYEPRFRGSIRNLRYSNCGAAPQEVDLIEREGVRETEEDPCRLISPCLYGGVCVATDMGATCDCVGTGHVGQYCEKEIIPREATFFGSEYLSYDLTQKGEPVVSTNDKVKFQFKTQLANGLIFYTGDGSDLLVVALLEGGLLIHITLLSGSFELEISQRNGYRRFDDNKWHSVVIERKSREIRVVIDQNMTHSGTIVGDFAILSSRVMYIAGSPNPGTTGDVRIVDNFRGCLKQVLYQADSINLDILQLAETDPTLLISHGNIAHNKCQDVHSSQPITFTDESAYLTGPKWNAFHHGSLGFLFRTNEPNGLLVYSRSMQKKRHRRFSNEISFFALEMLDGFLYLVLDLGYGVEKVVAYGYRLDDNLPHRVTLTHHGKKGTIDVDGESNSFKIKTKNHDKQQPMFDVYLGGLGPAKPFPYQVWTAMLNQGFVGCMQDLIIDGDNIDLVELAIGQGVQNDGTSMAEISANENPRNATDKIVNSATNHKFQSTPDHNFQDTSDQSGRGIKFECRVTQPQCPSYPCLHNGVCRDGWNRYTCDCSGTSFTGSVCQKPAVTLSFDGTQYLEVTLPEDSITEAEDVSLRFRTSQPDGLLFETSSQMHRDSLKMVLEVAQVVTTITLAGHSKSITMGQGLDDDRWHTVWMKRRAQSVEMRLDNSSAVQDILNVPESPLHVDSAYFGSNTNPSVDKHGELAGGDGSVHLKKVHLARRGTRSVKLRRDSGTDVATPSKNFEGQMEQFMFNDNPFFDMVRTGNIQNVHTNADYASHEEKISNPLTFRTTAAYLTTILRLYGTFTIYLHLKTTQPNGLILYSGAGNPDKDFLALELVDGKLKYVFNVGSGPRVVKANLRQDLNDNKWHQIAVVRHRLETHMLRVDDSVAYDNLPGGSSVHFDTDAEFYVGGVKKQMYNMLPDKVKSREGFQGCIGSLDIDGDSRNILEQHRSDIPEEYKDDVLAGCEGPQTECDGLSCDNRGICIQQWDTYTCDCDMTSFTGQKCQDDGIAYSFGSSGGLIHFAYSEKQIHNTKRDQVALGFITTQKDAVLTRINSRDSEDYIEMELVDGNIFVVYNMGTMDHPIGQLFDRVDDGAYHVVRFIRNGANASIQIDDTEPQFKNPSDYHQLMSGIELTGSQLTIFNRLGDIYIGGRKDKEGRIVRPFSGTIVGYVINSNPLLERAAEGDARVKIDGDVQLEIQPIHRHYGATAEPATSPVIVTPIPKDMSTPGMQSTMGVKTTPKGTGESDDIVFANPDCEEVDVSDCPDPDPDALINPRVTFRPTKPTTYSVVDGGDPDEPCDPDDEDCLTGSGSGFIGESSNTPSPEDSDQDPDQEKDIDIDIDKDQSIVSPDQVDTDTPIIIDINMTETPLRTDHPLMTPNPTPHSGPGGGASGNEGTGHDELEPLRKGSSTLGMNIGLIVGIALGVVLLLLIIAFAFYKYKSRDEGSYKMDESKNYSYETCNTKPPPTPQTNGSMSKSGSNCSKTKKKDIKEWYV